VLFDTFNGRIDAKLPMCLTVSVDFNDARGRKQERLTYDIDLKMLIGLELTGEKTIHHAAEALEGLSKTVKSWSDGSRLRVGIRDEDANEQRDRVQTDLTGYRPSISRTRPDEVWMALGRRPHHPPTGWKALQGTRIETGARPPVSINSLGGV
jgi:hypothetical protein